MADIQDVASQIHRDLELLAEFDENLQEGLHRLEELLEKAEEIDETYDRDLQELKELVKKVENGHHDEEELEEAREALHDVREMDYALREEEEDLEMIFQVVEELAQSGKKAIKGVEDLGKNVEAFERVSQE